MKTLEQKRICPHCDKQFGTIAAKKQHVLSKHTEQREPSMASIFIDGYLNRAMGEPNEVWLEEML